MFVDPIHLFSMTKYFSLLHSNILGRLSGIEVAFLHILVQEVRNCFSLS